MKCLKRSERKQRNTHSVKNLQIFRGGSLTNLHGTGDCASVHPNRVTPEKLSGRARPKARLPGYEVLYRAPRRNRLAQTSHANRNAVGKRVTTGWHSHESREPFVEFHGFQ